MTAAIAIGIRILFATVAALMIVQWLLASATAATAGCG